MYKHVLVIDDDPINNLICEKVMERLHFAEQIHSFLSAVEALTWLKQSAADNPVDFIFLDINLPVMDGWEFLRQVEASPELACERFQIHILSSSVSGEDQSKAQEHPLIHDFILKPLTLEKLHELQSLQPSE